MLRIPRPNPVSADDSLRMEKQDLAAFIGLLPDPSIVFRLVPGGRIELAQADPEALGLFGLGAEAVGERIEALFDEPTAETLRELARQVIRSRSGGRVIAETTDNGPAELTVLPVFDLDWTPRYVLGTTRTASGAVATGPVACDHDALIADLEGRIARGDLVAAELRGELEHEREEHAHREIELGRLQSAVDAEREAGDALRAELEGIRATTDALREELSRRSGGSVDPTTEGSVDTRLAAENAELAGALATARAEVARHAEVAAALGERLAQTVSDHAAVCEELQDQLRSGHDRISALEAQIAERDAAIAEREARLAEHTERLARAEAELEAARLVEYELRAARENATELERRVGALVARNEELTGQLEAFDARIDPLTGIGNRLMISERLRAIAEQGEATPVTVLFLDLDNFKLVNDSFGHDHGDAVLRAVAERLVASAPPEATVARASGDEFLVAASTIDADALVEQMRRALDEPVVVGGHELYVTASVGVVTAEGTDCTPERLLQRADSAVYSAKRNGPGRVAAYDESSRHQASRRLATESQLRRAIERDELIVHYQPIVEMLQGRIVGAEALVRWEHPERGLVAPGEFIPIADDTGLVVDIGAFVLEQALDAGVRWNHSGLAPLRTLVMSVNLSPRQLQEPGLVQLVHGAISRVGLDPTLVHLELTESTLMHEPDRMLEMLRELTSIGTQIAIDDFGTGYSSLAYLRELPASMIKIDQSFITGLGANPADSALVTGIVGLAHALDLEVLAEGVEKKHQVKELRRLGCQRAQGYHYSPPVPAEQFQALLEAGGVLPQEVPEVAEHPRLFQHV